MKKYTEYMDGIRASDTLHQRLLGLEASNKRPIPWKRYGAMAAALALVLGLGGYRLSRGGWEALVENFRPDAQPEIEPAGPVSIPEIGDEAPDIALVEPGDVEMTGMKTLGGYEIPQGGLVSYHILPYIEYGISDTRSELALDWDVPRGCTRRDLTQADFAALFGGEENLSLHLDWGGYTLTGWAAWYEDGSLWGVYINGEKIPVGLPPSASYPRPNERFEFAFVTGDQYPPTCIVYPDGVVNEVWDVPVTAWGCDGPSSCDRRVEFLSGGCGYRFDLTAADREQAELLVSRLTRWIVLEGLELDALSSDGAVLSHPWEADPDHGVGEPNWNDGGGDCPYCADGTPHTHPYDPHEGADPSYDSPRSKGENWCGTPDADPDDAMCSGYPVPCPNCGAAIPEGMEHDCVVITCPDCGDTYDVGGTAHHCAGYTCDTCGQTVPAGMEHSHEICTLPLAPSDAPGTYVCEVCGQSVQAGAAYSHQAGHHEESHHSGHH